MKRSIVVIINPVAGKGKTIQSLPTIKSFFDRYTSKIKVIYEISKYKGNVTELTSSYCLKGYTEFIAVGGDGTLSELVNGLDFSKSEDYKVAVIPLGTGNDFIKSMNGQKNIVSILENIANNTYKKIDVGFVNGHAFINVCTFGIDGPITYRTEKYKKVIPGKGAYLLSTLRTVLEYKSKRVMIETDLGMTTENILMIAIGNGKYIGGGMDVCPEAKMDDGLFEVCLVKDVSVLKFLKEFKKVYSHKINLIDEVNHFKVNKIKITGLSEPLWINADGNLIGKTPAELLIGDKHILTYNC